MLSLVFIAVFSSLCVYAQENLQHTLLYHDSIGSPQADLSQIRWIAGHWQGEAFGGITEEIWTPALGESMMGAFKLVVDKQVKFYELCSIKEENSSLILRLKHFHSDLKGWEEKDETVDFKLVKVSDHKVYFDGFTFESISEDEMNIYVLIEDGKERSETKFNYKKVNNITAH